MTDYKKYINALRKCAKEHENDTTYTGHIIVSDLCRDTANLLEALKQEPIKQIYIEREVIDKIREQMKDYLRGVEITLEVLVENDPLRPKMEGAKDTLEECLELIDKAESEDKE
jgi:hypothetical protein